MDRDFVLQLKRSFDVGFIEKEVEAFNHKWKLRTLTDKEAVIRDKFVPLSADTTLISARKSATLSLAIKEIDNRPVEDIFGGDIKETSSEDNIFGDNPFENRIFQLAKRVKEFLDDLPSFVVDELFNLYSLLEMEARGTISGLIKEEEEEDKKFRGGTVE